MSIVPASVPGQPPASAGAGTGQPPFGSSPATGPTQNRGFEAAGIQRLVLITRLATETLPLVGAASEPGRILLDFIKKMTSLVPAGSSNPAAEQNALQQLALRQQQMAPQMAALRAQSAAGQQPPQAGGQPGA